MPSAPASLISDRDTVAAFNRVSVGILHRKPRVLQVVTKLDLGGAETVAIDLVGALRDRVDFAVFGVFELHEPTPVGCDMAARLAEWGVPFSSGTAGHFKKGGALVAAWKLARAVRRFDADVVHLHSEVTELAFALATLLSPRMARMKVVRTVHNCELWIDWKLMGRWVTGRLANSHAIAVSEAAADADAAIITAKPRPRPPVVANGVVPPADCCSRTDAGPVKVLFAARFVPAKGCDLLPDIVSTAHAVAQRRDVEITIAGSGPQERDLRRALAGVAPDWTVRLAPPIERLSHRLGEWDAVLMPSRFEGLGLLAIEAFLAGVPVVATDAPGLSEVVPATYPFRARVNDARGLGSCLAQVIDDVAGARAQVAPLREPMIERFSAARMSQAYAEAYSELAFAGGQA